MTHTSSCLNHRDSRILTNEINQAPTSTRNKQVHPSTSIQQLGRRFVPCREQSYDIGVKITLYQYITNDFHYRPIGTISITTTFQHTGISTLQTKRKHIKRYIGAGFVNDADNSEGYTYLGQFHAIGTNRFPQHSPYR